MNKKILSVLLAGSMVLGLTACGGTAESDSDNTVSDTTVQKEEETTVAGENSTVEAVTTYPENKIKIGVELYDPTEVETLAMQSYFKALQESGLNVEFIYSEALDSAEAELAFIDDCYNAGCQAILGYYNIAMGETVQKCVDYGMYYWGSAFDYDEVVEAYQDNEYCLGVVNYGDGDYNAGYAIGEYFSELGAEKVVYASGGADFGVTMFVNRQEGFMAGIEDAGIEYITVSGFPGDSFFADQAAALSEDIDGVAASFNGLDFWAQPIATAGKTDTVPLATIGSITSDYVTAFENGSIDYLVSVNVQRFGIGVAMLINAIDGNANALKTDGKFDIYTTDMWYIDNAEDAKKYEALSVGTGVYRFEDLMSIIVNVNPEANTDALSALVDGGSDLTAIEEMHNVNDN